MNNNLPNQSPEHKGHLRKLSAEDLAAINARRIVRWEAYNNAYKAQGSVSEMRPNQPELIQNVAGVAMANESIQKASPYAETRQVFTQPEPVAQPEMPVTPVATMPVSAEAVSAANPLLADAYKALDRIYEQQGLGQEDVTQAA